MTKRSNKFDSLTKYLIGKEWNKNEILVTDPYFLLVADRPEKQNGLKFSWTFHFNDGKKECHWNKGASNFE